MSADIPPDFEKPWDMADIVLHTEDSEGKELHANKSVLAVFSPYFQALFFHDFKEKNDSVVTLKCGFATAKEILKIIHQVDFNYSSKGHKQYEAAMLVDLYRVADLYDFPTVRKLCADQMNERPSVELAKAAMESDLHDLLMHIVKYLSSDELKDFLALENLTHMFSKEDVRFFFNKINNDWYLFEDTTIPHPLTIDRPVMKRSQFDLTTPWQNSNVVILTKWSWLTPLFGQIETIEMVARNFRKYVKAADLGVQLLDARIQYVAEVDVEYATMKEILSVIHHCNMDLSSERILSPVLIYDMFRTAGVSQLDIPMIREMCVHVLKKQNTVDAWEVMCRLFGVCLESPMYKFLSYLERRQWICRSDGHLTYNGRDGVVVITHSQKDPLFNLEMVNQLLCEL